MKKGSELQKHVFGTYFELRIVLAAVGFLFPLVVIATGWLIDDRLGVQDSLSAYYWATKDGFNASRVPFVGGLFAVGTALYIYRGYTEEENLWLNIAGVCAIMIAVFPMRWTCENCPKGWTPHGTFAVTMFVCLAAVAWRRAGDTLGLLPKSKQAFFAAVYKLSAIALVASPLVAVVVNWFIGQTWVVLLAEWFGIWSFSVFWAFKTYELHQTQATSRLLNLPVVRGPTAHQMGGQTTGTTP
jgi:hypothetical protein